MADQDCPKCGTRFDVGEGWAKSAVATLIAAPAVPDMASQVRCPKCQYVFADSEVRFQRSSPESDTRMVLWVVAGGLAIWAIYQLF